jgi:hypothetical protein
MASSPREVRRQRLYNERVQLMDVHQNGLLFLYVGLPVGIGEDYVDPPAYVANARASSLHPDKEKFRSWALAVSS